MVSIINYEENVNRSFKKILLDLEEWLVYKRGEGEEGGERRRYIENMEERGILGIVVLKVN